MIAMHDRQERDNEKKEKKRERQGIEHYLD